MLNAAVDLPGYEFERLLGRGAMGVVYLARQASVGRQVAVKQIELSTGVDSEARDRFLREAQTLARLRHPNIVSIYDLVDQDGALFMVTEYVDGVTLQDLLDGVGVTPTAGLRVIADIAAALDAARRQEVVHRDLKPGNVFVTSTGVCKLGDFGLARLVEGEQAYATQVATVMGTPAYMSPEQAEGRPGIDHRTDLYSLAVVSYQLLVGRLPFELGADVLAMLEAHVSGVPARPTQLVRGFSKEVEKTLLQGLEKDPRKRQANALAFWEKLVAAADRAWPSWRQQSDLAALVRSAVLGSEAAGGGGQELGTMVARVTGVYETMLEPGGEDAPPALTTSVAPLQTTVAPLQTTVAPLQTTVAPLHTTVSPLRTTVAALETAPSAPAPSAAGAPAAPARPLTEAEQLEATLGAVTDAQRAPGGSARRRGRYLLLALAIALLVIAVAVLLVHR
jgi:predicted Ser/Thr protein kinase